MKNDERQLHIRLSEKVFKKLRVRCVYEDTTMQEYVTKLIVGSLGKYSNEKTDREKATKNQRGGSYGNPHNNGGRNYQPNFHLLSKLCCFSVGN